MSSMRESRSYLKKQLKEFEAAGVPTLAFGKCRAAEGDAQACHVASLRQACAIIGAALHTMAHVGCNFGSFYDYRQRGNTR